MENTKTKEFAKQWIESGKPCRYRCGFGFRGANSKTLTKDEALELLPHYSFGKGFYELSFVRDVRRIEEKCGPNCVVTEPYGDIVLMFNEYSDNDMW